MSAETSEELFPILVADLLDAESCDLLRSYAQRGEVVSVPLLSAPVDRRRHLLEIYTPGATSPLRLMAVPTGPPTADGFPLRLELCAEGEPGYDSEIDDAPTLMKPGAVVRSRVGTNPSTLTERHSRDLDPAVPVKTPTGIRISIASSPAASTGSMPSSVAAAWAPCIAGIIATSTWWSR